MRLFIALQRCGRREFRLVAKSIRPEFAVDYNEIKPRLMGELIARNDNAGSITQKREMRIKNYRTMGKKQGYGRKPRVYLQIN